MKGLGQVLLFLALLVLPHAVTQFEELVGMAEALLKGGGTLSTSASTLWRATNNASPDSFASTCSNSNSNSSSPISLKAEEEPHIDEKQVSGSTCPVVLWDAAIYKIKSWGVPAGVLWVRGSSIAIGLGDGLNLILGLAVKKISK